MSVLFNQENVCMRMELGLGALVGDTNMAAIPLFRNTNMVALTSREHTLLLFSQLDLRVNSISYLYHVHFFVQVDTMKKYFPVFDQLRKEFLVGEMTWTFADYDVLEC